MTVLLGTLSSSLKQIEAPYVSDWENAIALHAMQGTHLLARGKSHGFSRVVEGSWGISRVTAGMSIQNWSWFSEVRTPV